MIRSGLIFPSLVRGGTHPGVDFHNEEYKRVKYVL